MQAEDSPGHLISQPEEPIPQCSAAFAYSVMNWTAVSVQFQLPDRKESGQCLKILTFSHIMVMFNMLHARSSQKAICSSLQAQPASPGGHSGHKEPLLKVEWGHTSGKYNGNKLNYFFKNLASSVPWRSKTKSLTLYSLLMQSSPQAVFKVSYIPALCRSDVGPDTYVLFLAQLIHCSLSDLLPKSIAVDVSKSKTMTVKPKVDSNLRYGCCPVLTAWETWCFMDGVERGT